MTLDKSAARIRQMFGQIARRYDLLNHLLSLGIDRRWRRRTAELVAAGEGAQWILDVCTGTADLALAYARACGPDVRIVGTDFCRPMLAVAQGKCRRAGGTVPIFGQRREASARKWDCPLWFTQKSGRSRAGAAAHIALVEADTLQLPFPDDRFEIVCVAFGLRNVSDTRRRAAGDGPRLPARRAGGGAGILHAPAAGRWRPSTTGIFTACCRGSARPWLEIVRKLTITFRPA